MLARLKDGIVTAAYFGFSWEKTMSIFASWRMVCDHACGSGTERRRVRKVGKPRSAFRIGRLDNVSIVVRELKELASFQSVAWKYMRH